MWCDTYSWFFAVLSLARWTKPQFLIYVAFSMCSISSRLAASMKQLLSRLKGWCRTMPYTSDKQRRFMHAKHPDIAKRWDKEYGGKVVKPSAKKAAPKRAASKRGKK